MRAGKKPSSEHDIIEEHAEGGEEAIQQEQGSSLNGVHIALTAYQKGNTPRLRGAENPYAAALADVFGLEA